MKQADYIKKQCENLVFYADKVKSSALSELDSYYNTKEAPNGMEINSDVQKLLGLILGIITENAEVIKARCEMINYDVEMIIKNEKEYYRPIKQQTVESIDNAIANVPEPKDKDTSWIEKTYDKEHPASSFPTQEQQIQQSDFKSIQ